MFVSSFAGGEVFRGGCCFTRGAGRIFYFSPGDQEYPVYHHPDIQRVLANAVRWAAPRTRGPVPGGAGGAARLVPQRQLSAPPPSSVLSFPASCFSAFASCSFRSSRDMSESVQASGAGNPGETTGAIRT